MNRAAPWLWVAWAMFLFGALAAGVAARYLWRLFLAGWGAA